MPYQQKGQSRTMKGFESVEKNIAAFRRKYYRNLAIRGSLLSLLILLGYFLLMALLESALWLPANVRMIVVIFFFAIGVFCVARFLSDPLKWWLKRQGISAEQSAQMIGSRFPQIGDRLLNVLQLYRQPQTSALWAASINQKSQQFEGIPFDRAIHLRENLVYVKLLSIPILALIIILIFNRTILTQSTYRLVRFREEFSPAPPFQFVVDKSKLTAFFNEDYALQVSLSGDAIPDALYAVRDGQRLKMNPQAGRYEYVFERVQAGFSFHLEGAGFLSPTYTLTVLSRPELLGLRAQLEYPRYLGRQPVTLQNAGNLEVPEGTRITWLAKGANAEKADMTFASENEVRAMIFSDDQTFQFSKIIRSSEEYLIRLYNPYAQNKDDLRYTIAVIKDEFPTLSVQPQGDSVLFNKIWIGGYASDDYGISDVAVRYQVLRDAREENGSFSLPINAGFRDQRILHTWSLDSLFLKPGDQLLYFVQVWDNDGVNGRKLTQSPPFRLVLPSRETLQKEIERSTRNTQEKFQQSVKRAGEIKRSVEEAIQKLKSKQQLDWQDKQMLQALIEQRKQLDQQLEQLRREARDLEEKKDQFTNESERLQEKAEEVQKQIDDLMSDEQRKLLEELEKLLKDNAPSQQLMKLLEQMQRQERDFKKEMERAQELYKQLQYEYKIEQTAEQLQEQLAKQESLQQKTESLAEGEKKKPQDLMQEDRNADAKSQKERIEKQDTESAKEKSANELAAEQEELRQEMEELKKEMQELEHMGKEVEKPADLPGEQQQSEILNDQQKSKELLEEGNPRKSAQMQKQAIQKMKQMKNQLEGAMANMQMEMDMDNLESLRQIIHGLVKLSFDQENITKEFLPIQQTDPAYVVLSQRQLKLKEDSKVLEDSLLALSKRDPKMNAIVTKEIGKLNDHVDRAVEYVRDRKKGNAGSEMQFAMTSINNLALMLNDHFDMMMQMMQNAMMMPGKGKSKSQKQAGLGQKQQEINRRTEELMKNGKPGREMSEELARLAMEQEAIRRMLQEMQEGAKKNGQKPGGELPGKMEETELDLINKRLTNQLLQRQREILTRLLETEKSMREQNLDEQRKGETARDYENALPRSFEQYIRLKEKELELLKTVPPKLYPYYKQEVSEYFKRLGDN